MEKDKTLNRQYHSPCYFYDKFAERSHWHLFCFILFSRRTVGVRGCLLFAVGEGQCPFNVKYSIESGSKFSHAVL